MFVNYEFTFFRDVEDYRQLQTVPGDTEYSLGWRGPEKHDIQYGADQLNNRNAIERRDLNTGTLWD